MAVILKKPRSDIQFVRNKKSLKKRRKDKKRHLRLVPDIPEKKSKKVLKKRTFLTDPKYIKAIRDRQRTIDQIKMIRLKRNEFIREQILEHNNIHLLMTEVLGYNKVKDFHMLMWYHNQNNFRLKDKQKWHLTLAPRGGGKSTVLTISKIVLHILQNPNIKILIASKTEDNAKGFLHEIKNHLMSQRLIEIFGVQQGVLWNEGSINVRGRTIADKEPTVLTIGYTGTLSSKHFNEIYCDDLVEEENSKTEIQRQKLVTWLYKVLDHTLEPDGEMNFIGTRYHPDDLYGELINTIFTKKSKKGKVKKRWYIRIPALMLKRKVKKKCKKWERYISFWPEKFSTKFLIEKKRDQGTIIFNSQMMNDVEAMKGKIFKYDWFEYYSLSDINLSKLHIYSGVDLAIKQSDNADKFAHCTIGVDPETKDIYVLDYYNRVTHYTDQKKVIRRKFKKYDPIKVAVEANGYQRALLQDMKSNGSMAHIRAFPVFTDTDKTLRAWKLAAYFEDGKVFITRNMHGLQEQLLSMPDGRYKDLFDALDIAISAALHGKRKQRKSEPGVLTGKKQRR